MPLTPKPAILRDRFAAVLPKNPLAHYYAEPRKRVP